MNRVPFLLGSLKVTWDDGYDEVLTFNAGDIIMDIYPETVGGDKMPVKLEIKPGTSGNQYLHVNGHRFMQFNDNGTFETSRSAAFTGGRWDSTRFVLSGMVKPISRISQTTVRSSTGDVFYRLTTVDGNAVACTCKAFEYRSDCKHIQNFDGAW